MQALLLALTPTFVLASIYVAFLPGSSRDRPWLRRGLVLTIQLLQLRYSLWRVYTVAAAAAFTLHWLVCAVFLVLELVAVALSYRATKVLRFTSTASADANEQTGWWETQPIPPLVDVFIPTYNEERHILLRTLSGAMGIAHPRLRVWLLDDGRRASVRALAEQYGVGYVTRDSNAGYKAGNLNNGLAHVMSLPEKPDFIAVFDADFVAKPQFAARTLALMKDPAVAIVQTPQHFYNPDPFQYVLRADKVWPDEQRNWFDARLPCLDGAGWATCCGTSCLVRVAPLMEVGGFPTESVSEDTLLSIKFWGKGLRTRYLNEVLSLGLAPEGIHEFLTQRVRWCLGSLQIAMSRRWGPRSNPKRFQGFVNYLEQTYRWSWHSLVKVAWMLIPPAYFLFGFTVLEAELFEFVGYFAPILVARFGMTWMNRNTFMPVAADAPALLMAPFVLATTLGALRGSDHGAFRVTDKGKSRQRLIFHWRPALLPLSLLLLTAFSIVYAWFDRFSMLHSTGSHGLVLFWAFVNVMVLLATLSPCIEPPRYRSAERYACDLAVGTRSGHAWRLLDVSERGCRVDARGGDVSERLELELPTVGWVTGNVRRRHADGSLGVALELGPTAQVDMIRWVYCTDTFIRPVAQWSFWGSVGSVLRYAFSR